MKDIIIEDLGNGADVGNLYLKLQVRYNNLVRRDNILHL